MRSAWSSAVGLAGMALSVGALACGGSTGTPPSKRDAGTASEGGRDAEAARAGKGGDEATFQLPSCVRDLIQACGTDTACRAEIDEDAGVERDCYESGARIEQSTVSACGSESGRSELVARKADGSPCFAFEISGLFQAQFCEHTDLAWRDGQGTTVATGWAGGGMSYTISITCSSSGETASCSNDACRNAIPLLFGRIDCDPGTCGD